MKNKILICLTLLLIVGVIGFNLNLNVKGTSKTSGLTFAKLQLLAFGESCNLSDVSYYGEWGEEINPENYKCTIFIDPAEQFTILCKNPDTNQEYTTTFLIHTYLCIPTIFGEEESCRHGCYATGEMCDRKLNGKVEDLTLKTCGK